MGFTHPNHLKRSVGEDEYVDLLNHVVDTGRMARILQREDWRDNTLTLIAYYLATMAKVPNANVDLFLPPYAAKSRKPKTPEQRLKEAQLRAKYLAAQRGAGT